MAIKTNVADLRARIAKAEATNESLKAKIEAGRQMEFRLHRLNRLHTVLSKIADIVVRTHDKQELYDTVCRIVVEDGLLRMAFVAEVDAEAKLARPVASYGAGREYLREPTSVIPTDGGPLSMGTLGTAIRTGVHDVCNNIAGASRMKPWHQASQKNGLLANASFPLTLHGTIIGVMCLYAGETDYFLDDEISLMIIVASNVSFALEVLEKERHRKRAEAALQESEEMFRNMFTANATGIATSTPTGCFLQVNAAFCQMLGYSEEELRLCNFATLTHPDDLALNLKLRDEMLAGTRDSIVLEKRYLKKNGDTVWTRHSVSAARSASGEITMFIAVAENITERKRAEDALRQSEELLRLITDLVPHGIFAKDANGRHIFVNRALAEMAGFSIDEMLGKDDFDLVTDKDQAEAFRADDRAVIQSGTKKLVLEEPRTDLSGRTRYLQTIKIPFTVAETGKPAVLGVCIDITEQRQTRTLLEESEGRYRALVEWSPESISVQRAGKIIYVNPSAVAMMGATSANDLVGKSSLDLVHPDYREMVRERLKNSADRGDVLPMIEEKLIKMDGTAIDVEVQGAPIIYDGEPALYGSMRDITERKRMEEKFLQLNNELEQRVIKRTAALEAANKELEAFSYSVSHDLRSPLRAVTGFAGIVLDEFATQVPADARRYLERIRNGAQRMGQLIDDLLAFSRLSRQSMRRLVVDSAKLVQDVLDESAQQRRGRQIDIQVGKLPTCHGDRALLKQIWVNLISNAVKYTGGREAAFITIGCQKENHENVFFVRDNGAGFDMQYANKLFGVFQRLHRADEFEGTGVGLAIVQRIVHRHGGRIWADAVEGRGATFYFTIEGEKNHE